jgi:hypothetical protein
MSLSLSQALRSIQYIQEWTVRFLLIAARLEVGHDMQHSRQADASTLLYTLVAFTVSASHRLCTTGARFWQAST